MDKGPTHNKLAAGGLDRTHQFTVELAFDDKGAYISIDERQFRLADDAMQYLVDTYHLSPAAAAHEVIGRTFK